jgi:tetratricopeptide (TPR) repeat protein
MTQMFFSLRFKAQLRRTRPEVVSSLEELIAGTIKASGGAVRIEQKYLFASFDEGAVAFWLDMVTVLETMLKALEAPELYGHICVIGRDISDDYLQLLSRLPADAGETGIWCAAVVQKALEPYAAFDVPLPWTEDNPLAEGYAQIKSFRNFEDLRSKQYPHRGKIERRLKQESHRRNTVLLGPAFMGKMDGLSRFCAAYLGKFPALVIRFGSGGRSLSCLTDSLGPELRGFFSPSALEELDALGASVFRERLRDTFSVYLIQKGRRFFHLLLKSYTAAAKICKAPPVLMLENIQEAGAPARQIVLDTCRTFSRKGALFVYGTALSDDCLPLWKGTFSQVIQFPAEDFPVSPAGDLAGDLWEITYICGLLQPYFPSSLFARLIEEEGKNPAMISRAFGMLACLGVINSEEDPRPRLGNGSGMIAAGMITAGINAAGAEQALGGRADRLRSMVRNRLLDWVLSGKLKPCFSLLKALKDLGGSGDDGLILDSIYGDLSNDTYAGVEEAIRDGSFGAVVGENRVPALLYIFRTLRALIHGGEAAIREAFLEPYPETVSFIGYKAQILTNLASFSLGKNDVAGAAEVIKESMLINQGLKGGRGLAHTFRLFSLVYLSKQQLSDAIEYFTFAMENAEKSENLDELAVSAYYSAGAHFLFGNLSKAERLARQAEQTASLAGRPGWADRARFLQGRFRFESGRYKEALGIFKNLEEHPAAEVSPAAAQVLAAWTYRTHIFLRNHDYRISGDKNDDALFFEAEAAYLAGDYRKTVEMAERIQAALPNQNFMFMEQPDWRSGFSQCELLLFPCRAFWDRMISAYQALGLSRLGPGSNRKQAVHIMERIMRDERMPDTDPNDAFYFYAYYRILMEYGATEVDMNTAVSMAFKRLQRRASRIDDPDTKRVFLSLNYWNSSLGLAAKEHKLI